MRVKNIGSYKTLNEFIKVRLSLLDKREHSFSYLYSLLFLDRDNIMFEYSEGYRIKKYTYGDIQNRVEIKAKNIYSKVKNNNVIGIYLDNNNVWVETYWAILRSGNTPLLLNNRLPDLLLEKAIKEVSCKYVITNSKSFSVTSIKVEEIEIDNGVLEGVKFGSSMLLMTSGTSNNVKVCLYEAAQLFNILKQSKEIISSNKKMKKHYQGELKVLMFLPFYHIFGFVACYLWFAFYSRTFVILKDMMPNTIRNTIVRHHVTHIFAVPLFWETTHRLVEKEIQNKGAKVYKKYQKGMKLVNVPLLGLLIKKRGFKAIRNNLFGESISFMITGGSVIKQSTLRFFNSIGYHFVNGYGMSEVGITSVELSNKKKYILSGSIGKPLPGVEYAINNDSSLLIKGNTLASKIFENGKEISLKEALFTSFDIAKVRNGHYYIEGREDDLIITSNGENLNPNIIEPMFVSSSYKNVALVYEKSMATPILLVEVDKFISKEKASSIEKEILEVLKNNNLINSVGKVVLVVDPLIKDDEFKLNRKRLASDYVSHKIKEYSVPKHNEEEDKDELLKEIKALVASTLNVEVSSLTSETDFFTDLGGTSLDYYVVSEAINDKHHVNILSSQTSLSMLGDIKKYIEENL